MLKMLVAFIIFAVIALTVVFKMGDKVDMQGEAGGHTEAKTETAAPEPVPAAAPAAAPAVQEEKK